MELSLHGSQICLATRTKPNNAKVINYPISSRPASALVGGISKRPLSSKRPQSADINFLAKYKKRNQDYSDENNIKLKKFSSSSSSNILKLLLSEPIKRYWSQDQDEISDTSLGAKIKSKANQAQQMGSEATSSDASVEEDIQECFSSCGDDNNKNNVSWRDDNILKKPLSKNRTSKFSSSLNNSKDFKTKIEVKKNNLEKQEEKTPMKSSAWFDETPNKTNPDLPGRVSFSTNDVYEIDYSDYDGSESMNSTEEQTKMNKKSVHFFEESKTSGEQKPGCSDTCSQFCCSSKYNTFHDETKNGFQSEQKTDQIIEDYKREIANINRRHELELQLADIPKTNPVKSFPNFYNNDFHLKEPNIHEDFRNDLIDIKIDECSSIEKKDSLEDFYESVEENKVAEVKNKKDETKWNNYEQKNNSSTKSDSSNEIIKNYLAVKDPRSPEKQNSKKQNNLNKKKSFPIKKPKSASSGNNSKAKPTLKKSKSISCLRQNSNLDEFHMEKVETWMSMHEENFSEKGDGVKSTKGNEKDWREESTPVSTKTDDEGNYSLDDQIDNISTESSYEEIRSMIRDIEDKKRKSNEIELAASAAIKTDVEFKLNSILNVEAGTSSGNGFRDQVDSNDKVKEIMSYLDDIDTKCETTLDNIKKFIPPPDSDRTEMEYTVEADIIEDVPKISDLIMLPNHQLARRIVNLSLRSNELSNAIQLSKEHISFVRQEKQKAIRIEKQTTQNKLKEQKKHYESIVQRHQGFIEQLLKDKSGLCDKVTNITRRIDSQNQAWEHKLQTEVSRMKETVLAGEKIKREKWVRDNTKKIKELTVKGLEMEINKMTSNHQTEINDLKCQHQQDLLETIDETRRKYELMEKAIRDSYAKDREGAIEKERNAIRERFEKQMESEQKSFEQQKHRLLIECNSEKERIYFELKEKEVDFDVKREQLIRGRKDVVEQMRKEFKDKLRQQESKHESDLSSLQDQFESDFIIWKREHESAMKRREVEREDAIRQQCRLDRDRQIDSIIAKVDVESIKNQQEFEVKFIRMKEKYDAELKEVEKVEKTTRERYNENRIKLGESEANIQNLQATVNQLEIQLNHSNKMCEDFTKEKKNMKENARKEMKQDVKQIQTERDNEIQRIYARVQLAIEKKDSALELLQQENKTLKERCFKLEAVIRQQRKDYCIK